MVCFKGKLRISTFSKPLLDSQKKNFYGVIAVDFILEKFQDFFDEVYHFFKYISTFLKNRCNFSIHFCLCLTRTELLSIMPSIIFQMTPIMFIIHQSRIWPWLFGIKFKTLKIIRLLLAWLIQKTSNLYQPSIILIKAIKQFFLFNF